MYTRGKFGIEYTPPEPRPETPWLGRVLFIVALAAIVLVARSFWMRAKAHVAADAGEPSPAPQSETTPTVVTSNDLPAIQYPSSVMQNRPVKVRNLLLRLERAERANDVEMAVTTIEQLREAPGAADLDDRLARRLGTLNLRRLFEGKSAQWTVRVKVKRGELATRIAYEHGSTLASLIKLNDDALDKLRVGQELVVMNHPRFNLVISRRTRTADLLLNGKFFKRYDLTDAVTGAEGSYATTERFRTFCSENGVPFKPLDRAELEMLLPKGTACFIKEI